MAKYCQSCGMPMAKDPEQGGSNADGSKNSEYCSYCWQQGSFTGDFKDAKQMQAFCCEKLHELGYPRWLAWLMTRQIPRLARWQNHQ